MHTICSLSVWFVLVSFVAGKVGYNSTSEILKVQDRVTQLNERASVAYSKPTTPTTNCTLTHFEFPRFRQNEDFVWYRMHFPLLKSGTMCAWIKGTDLSHHNHFMSYAEGKQDNQILISFFSPSTLRVNILNYIVDFNLPNPEKLNHVCVWFDSKHATVGSYINGDEMFSQGYPGNVIPGGGSLILGQDQDKVNAGKLNSNECFSGTIDNFMIWPRVLSQLEVLRIAALGQCPVDHAVVMTTDRVEMWGETLYHIPNESPLAVA